VKLLDARRRQLMSSDRWADWLIRRRQRGFDERQVRALTKQLGRVRNRVLAGAWLRRGMSVLDVGAGTGLLALEARRRVRPCQASFRRAARIPPLGRRRRVPPRSTRQALSTDMPLGVRGVLGFLAGRQCALGSGQGGVVRSSIGDDLSPRRGVLHCVVRPDDRRFLGRPRIGRTRRWRRR
jgi:hypothetical protein